MSRSFHRSGECATGRRASVGIGSISGTPAVRHMMLHRGDLHRVLADAVRGLKPNAIKLGKRCAALAQSDERAEGPSSPANGPLAAYVIGADGIHSNVRARLFGLDRPEFTGCVAWRGLVPMEHLPSGLSADRNQLVRAIGHVLHYPVRRGAIMNFIGTLERLDWQIESWTAEARSRNLHMIFVAGIRTSTPSSKRSVPL